MEISKDRIWVLASNKHKCGGVLQFWGYLTADEDKRSYGGYPTDFSKCERYATTDKANDGQNNFPTLDSNCNYLDLTETEHYWIKVEELEKCKCYRKKTIFEEC